jgi:hypothetical protein
MTDEDFLKDATAIVEKAQSRGLYVRFIGALAVYVHSLDTTDTLRVFKSLARLGEGRPMFTDLDLVLYSKQRNDVTKLLEELGFKPDNMANMMFGGRRLIYYHPQNKYPVDLFLNRLEFSHDVNFGEKPGSGRLELDYPTITLEDIVLEKLQIRQINRKDVVDLVVLFLGHDLAELAGKNVIDGGHISRTLSEDWGFWYDATRNLASVTSLAHELSTSNPGIVTAEQDGIIGERVLSLRKMIDAAPKTKSWEKRAKVGTSKPWYRDVDEVVR